MERSFRNRELLVPLLSLVFRLPFLYTGYGREFDAWSNVLNAKILSETGLYEVSRLPGHPLQELIYSLMWSFSQSYFFFNLLSAIATAWAAWRFYRIAKHYQIERSFEWAIAFQFVPVVFIASTSAIDYNFALAFILAGYYQFLKKNLVGSGLMIGLATAFRISSLGFLLPLILLLPIRDWFKAWPMVFTALVSTALAYLMPFLTYSWGFLDFHKPPFPGWSSVLFKLGLGIWGIPLLIALLFSLLKFRFKSPKSWQEGISLNAFLLIIVLMQLAVFMRLPFKSEFFIPAIPFFLLLWAKQAPNHIQSYIHYIALASLLFFGFDYANPYRGAEPMESAIHFEAGGKELYLSPFQGPLSIDQSKRRVKSRTVEACIKALEEEADPVWLVAGWYWPELMLKLPQESQHFIDHYSSLEELKAAQKAGLRILYLPEIDQQNPLMHEDADLRRYGDPLL